MNKKKILKPPAVLTRAQDRNLSALMERLRKEIDPKTAMEEFFLEKLAVDMARLTRLYKHDKDILQGWHSSYSGGALQPNLDYQLINGRVDPFLRYKRSVEKDIKEGYSQLNQILNDRNKLANDSKQLTFPSQKNDNN